MEADHILDTPEPAGPQEYVYSGFWPRVAASLVDFLILLPITIAVVCLNFFDLHAYYYTALLALGVSAVYEIYFISKNGATPGKRAMKLKVINVDGAAVTVAGAFLRHLPTLLLGALSIVVTIIIMQSANADAYEDLGWMSKMRYVASLNPVLSNIPNWLSNVWWIASVVVLLVNKQNRTIHDFIADTVVVKTDNE